MEMRINVDFDGNLFDIHELQQLDERAFMNFVFSVYEDGKADGYKEGWLASQKDTEDIHSFEKSFIEKSVENQNKMREQETDGLDKEEDKKIKNLEDWYKLNNLDPARMYSDEPMYPPKDW